MCPMLSTRRWCGEQSSRVSHCSNSSRRNWPGSRRRQRSRRCSTASTTARQVDCRPRAPSRRSATNVLVVDASPLAPVVADGGADGRRFRERLRGEVVVGPDLLRVEVTSVLRRHANSGRLSRTCGAGSPRVLPPAKRRRLHRDALKVNPAACLDYRPSRRRDERSSGLSDHRVSDRPSLERVWGCVTTDTAPEKSSQRRTAFRWCSTPSSGPALGHRPGAKRQPLPRGQSSPSSASRSIRIRPVAGSTS